MEILKLKDKWAVFENEEVAQLVTNLSLPFIPEENGWEKDKLKSNSFSACYDHASGEPGQKTLIVTNYDLDPEYRTYFFQKRRVLDFGLGLPKITFNGKIYNLAEYKMLEKSVL